MALGTWAKAGVFGEHALKDNRTLGRNSRLETLFKTPQATQHHTPAFIKFEVEVATARGGIGKVKRKSVLPGRRTAERNLNLSLRTENVNVIGEKDEEEESSR